VQNKATPGILKEKKQRKTRPPLGFWTKKNSAKQGHL
jgi:hypothetical protein